MNATAGAGLLADIIEHPDDDTPRLVYADWLDDEAGGPTPRAEFIRVQVELASLCPRCISGKTWYWCQPCERLRKRERELWEAQDDAGDWLISVPMPAHTLIPQNSMASPKYRSTLPLVIFRRGFADKVRCKAADWLAHADALLSAHPIREVRLTTRPVFDRWFWQHKETYFRLQGREKIYGSSDLGLSHLSNPSHNRIRLALLRAEFGERITFRLPAD
jgi:uncharacterized protein (TIGR02996 family)